MFEELQIKSTLEDYTQVWLIGSKIKKNKIKTRCFNTYLQYYVPTKN